MPEHLLLVEDNPSDASLLQSMLEGRRPHQYATVSVATLTEAKAAIGEQRFDAVLLDLSLPDSYGLETIGRLAAAAPNLPIVVLTGVADEDVALEAVRCGAQDYLIKGRADATTIAHAIQYAIDRKQTEEALHAQRRDTEAKNQQLQESQRRAEAYRDRYVDLYDFAPLGYVTLDEDGYVQEINLAGAQLLNADRDMLTGYPFSEHVTEKDLPVFREHLRKCVDGHCEMTSELRLAARDGRLISVQLHSIPIPGSDEDVTLCKTAITDITQRKEMEETIRRSGAFLQTVIDAIPDVLLVIGTDYRILLANRAAREMAGGIDPTVGMTCHQLSHHRDLPCTGKDEPCPLCQVVATKVPVTVTHMHYDPGGKGIFVEVSAAPVLDESGEVRYIIEACRDVSQRKRAEEALAQERTLLRTLIDNLPDLIYVKDIQNRFVAANLATARVMGATAPNDLLGKTDYDFYPQTIAAEYHAAEEELLRSGQPLLNKEEPHEDPNGQPRTILTSKVPLKNSQGDVVGLVGISRDITERKHMEEALQTAHDDLEDKIRQRMAELAKATEELVVFRRFAEASAQGFGIASLDGHITYVNSAMCRLLGEERPEHVIGTHLSRYLSEEHLRRREEEVLPALMREGNWQGELAVSRHGRSVSVLQNSFLIRDERGNPAHLATVLTDITERKRAEEALRHSEERYRGLVEACPDAVVMTDLSGQILFASRQTQRLLGLADLDVLTGRSVFNYVIEEDRGRLAANMSDLVKAGTRRSTQYTALRADGTVVPAEASSAVIADALGHPIAVMAIIRDTSERNRGGRFRTTT